MNGPAYEKVLTADTVHVWRADLSRLGERYDRCWMLLAEEEKRRAYRLRDGVIRHRFVAGRAILRCVLSRYLATEAGDIRIGVGPHGKPHIGGGDAGCGLAFNVSHSGNLALVAVASQRHVGVDVEIWRKVASIEGLVEKCFAEEEGLYWQGLPANLQVGVFFDVWTLKEAFVKAVGKGIALGLKQCIIMPGKRPVLTKVPVGCGDPGDWMLCRLNLGSGVSGAVAVMGRTARVELFDFEVSGTDD
ncbi:MAG: 4'-phosphopantetheinyl transferase superfamily protein [Pseudomonadota bacterium]